MSAYVSDRQALSDPQGVERIQDRLIEALRLQVSRNHSTEENLFATIIMKLPELRTLGSQHNEMLRWYRARWQRVELPPLFAEIYDIPKSIEDAQSWNLWEPGFLLSSFYFFIFIFCLFFSRWFLKFIVYLDQSQDFVRSFYVLLDTVVSLALRINPSRHLVYLTNGYSRTFTAIMILFFYFFEAQGTAIHFFSFFLFLFFFLFLNSLFMFLSEAAWYCRTIHQTSIVIFLSAQDQPIWTTVFGHLWPPGSLQFQSLRFWSFYFYFLLFLFLFFNFYYHLFISTQEFETFFLSKSAVHIIWEFCSQELHLDTTGSLTPSKILTMQQYKPGSLQHAMALAAWSWKVRGGFSWGRCNCIPLDHRLLQCQCHCQGKDCDMWVLACHC